MAQDWILAVDQGTTNTKALLFDSSVRPVFSASASVRLLQPRAGWVEQDPMELWQSVVAVANECSAYANSHDGRIAGIALTNQRETAVTWRAGASKSSSAAIPVGNAITWQCRRSSEVCGRLADEAETIRAIAGLPLDPLQSATKWAWLLDAEPGLRAEVESGDVLFGTVDSWILYNMTGGRMHATDHTNASRTALMSLTSIGWDEQLLEAFGIARRALPEIRPSSTNFGVCSAIPALSGVPIVSMIGDSHGALVGHGCFESGAVKATYGTGSSLMMLTDKLAEGSAGLARTVAWSSLGDVRFALEGNIAMSGAAVQWVGEFLGLARPADDAAELASTVRDSGGMILVPAMVGLGAPHWDTVVRGIACNLERSHTSAHLARAALDSIAHQVSDVLECMERSAGVCIPVLLADGGATRNRTLMQMQADIIGRSVLRSSQEELSARGAAMLGGLTLGWWRSVDEFPTISNEHDRFEPSICEGDRGRMRRSWGLAVKRARLREENV